MAKSDEIMEKLKDVQDPELGMDIVNLGFIYDIKVDGKNAHITMTLTFPGCPYGPQLVEEITDKVKEVKDVENVDVDVTFEPPWQPPKELRAMYGV